MASLIIAATLLTRTPSPVSEVETQLQDPQPAAATSNDKSAQVDLKAKKNEKFMNDKRN